MELTIRLLIWLIHLISMAYPFWGQLSKNNGIAALDISHELLLLTRDQWQLMSLCMWEYGTHMGCEQLCNAAVVFY